MFRETLRSPATLFALALAVALLTAAGLIEAGIPSDVAGWGRVQ